MPADPPVGRPGALPYEAGSMVLCPPSSELGLDVVVAADPEVEPIGLSANVVVVLLFLTVVVVLEKLRLRSSTPLDPQADTKPAQKTSPSATNFLKVIHGL